MALGARVLFAAVCALAVAAIARGNRPPASRPPGLVSAVELSVQSTTVLSVTFDAPDDGDDTSIDMYLVEWSLESDFSHASHGYVLASRALRKSSFQYDIVALPRRMTQPVHVRVSAHNAHGWGGATLSTPRFVALADDHGAPDTSTRRGAESRAVASFGTKAVRFVFVVLVLGVIGLALTHCFASLVAVGTESERQRGGYARIETRDAFEPMVLRHASLASRKSAPTRAPR